MKKMRENVSISVGNGEMTYWHALNDYWHVRVNLSKQKILSKYTSLSLRVREIYLKLPGCIGMIRHLELV